METRAPSASFELISTETSERLMAGPPIPKAHYQRRVRVTLTRHQAALLERAMLRLSADPVAQAKAGIDELPGAARTCKLVWRRVDMAIQNRDRKQRAKEEPSAPIMVEDDNTQDTPLF